MPPAAILSMVFHNLNTLKSQTSESGSSQLTASSTSIWLVCMSHEVTFQVLWTNVVRAMCYGTYRIIPLNIAERAWPATGQNSVLQLARVVGGSPPEPTRTTIERIQHEFSDDLSFTIAQTRGFGNIHIERLLDCCPYCQGLGFASIDGQRPVPISELEDLEPRDVALLPRQRCAHHGTQLPILTEVGSIEIELRQIRCTG